MASSVSVSVPIWFTLIRIELAQPVSIPFFRKSTLVTNRSSPTSWHLSPISAVSSCQPSQSFSDIPSSIESMGYFATSDLRYSTCSFELRLAPFSPSNLV